MAMLNNQRVIHHIPYTHHYPCFFWDVNQCLPISWAFGGSKDARNVPRLNGFAFISHTQTIRLLRDWEHQLYANNTFYNQGLQEEAAFSAGLQVVIFQHLRYCLGPGFSIKRCENFDENSCRLGFRNGRLGYLGKLRICDFLAQFWRISMHKHHVTKDVSPERNTCLWISCIHWYVCSFWS